MSLDRTISSNAFGPGVQIHQGDTVIHNHLSGALPKACRVIPFNRNEDIVYRPEIAAQLSKLLSPAEDGECYNAALWGLGGSGKTQIALDYAYRRSRDDPACAIFWVHADNEAAFERDYRTIARKLDLDDKLNGEELLFKVCDCIESQLRWLLILDNADDLALFGVGDTLDQGKSLTRYLPQGHGGSILWTSRDKQIVALAGPRRGVEVGHMSAGEAKKLLSVTRDEDIRHEETHDVHLLFEELQWLPLAISQAGFYLRRYSTPIKEYLSKLLKEKSRWDTLKHTEHDRYRPDVLNSVLETWDISIQRVEQENKVAYKILHVIAYIDYQNIPLSLIQTMFTTKIDSITQEALPEENEVTLNRAILRLKEFSLISERKTEDDEPSFDMHKLIHEAIRFRLSHQNIRSRAYFLCIAASTIKDLFVKTKRETWAPCEKYATHALRLSDWTEASETEVPISGVKPYLFIKVVSLEAICYFINRGPLSKATLLVERLLSRGNKMFGEKDPATIYFTSTLSRLYMLQGLYNEAEKFGSQALALSEKAHGVKGLTTTTMMRYLADVYSMRGQFKAAERLYRTVLSLLGDVRGEKHVEKIKAMEDLASLYHRYDLTNNAVKLKSEALALRYEVLGEKNCATIDAEQDVVKLFMYKREWKQAEELQTRILSMIQETGWGTNANTNKAMGYLAIIYHCQRKYAKSRELRSKIFLRNQGYYGKNHPSTIRAMTDLASAYCREGKFILAERLQRKSLSLHHEVLGETNVMTIVAMGQTAFICRERSLFKEANELEERAIFLRQKFYEGISTPFFWEIDNIAAKRKEKTPISHRKTTSVSRKAVAPTRCGKNVSAQDGKNTSS